MAKRKPKVFIATPEIIMDLPEGMGNLARRGVSFKVGGMADVNSTLIAALSNDSDMELYAAVPKWKSSLRRISRFTEEEIHKLREALAKERMFLIEDAAFNNVGVSGTNIRAYESTWRFSPEDRALAFNRYLVNDHIPNLMPDITWGNDWMTAFVPAKSRLLGIGSMYTLHNIFTKEINKDAVIRAGIDARELNGHVFYKHHPDHVHPDQNPIDMLATAVFASDYITTVSPSFLNRVLGGEIEGISDHLLSEIKNKARAGRAFGILNPRDESEPTLLDDIARCGSQEATVAERKENARRLRDLTGLKQIDGPILFYPNRLFDPKNPQLLVDTAQYFADTYGMQTIVCANGPYAKAFMGISNNMVAYSVFEEEIEELAKSSWKVYGLMTPHIEPCGGPNIRYPARGVPIIGHDIDGIHDSVTPLDWERGNGNGFVYSPNTAEALKGAMAYAHRFYSQSDEVIMRNLTRIAKESAEKNSAKTRANEYKEKIIIPLFEERQRQMH